MQNVLGWCFSKTANSKFLWTYNCFCEHLFEESFHKIYQRGNYYLSPQMKRFKKTRHEQKQYFDLTLLLLHFSSLYWHLVSSYPRENNKISRKQQNLISIIWSIPSILFIKKNDAINRLQIMAYIGFVLKALNI